MSEQTAEEMIREAIALKRPMSAVYRDRKRVFCPHVLGWKEGRLQALVYLYAGESESGGTIVTPEDPGNGPPQYWRCLEVARLEQLAVLPPGPWYTCQRHTKTQSCADNILAEVSDWPE